MYDPTLNICYWFLSRNQIHQQQVALVLKQEVPGREEEHHSPYIRPEKSVDPGSVPGPPLLPHWDFQSDPTHLPSLWLQQFPQGKV